MRNIMWFRIVITGLAVEIVYALYISFIRWYEPTMLTSLFTLGGLMLLGGFLVGRKANTKHILQGALVGLTGVLFYIIVTTIMKPDEEQISSNLQVYLEHLVKISGGAIGGYLGLKQNKSA